MIINRIYNQDKIMENILLCTLKLRKYNKGA